MTLNFIQRRLLYSRALRRIAHQIKKNQAIYSATRNSAGTYTKLRDPSPEMDKLYERELHILNERAAHLFRTKDLLERRKNA